MMKVSELSSTPGFDHSERDGCSFGNGMACSGFEWGFNGMVKGPSACILWSAVALGALAKGAPSEEVSPGENFQRRDEVTIWPTFYGIVSTRRF